MDKSSSNIEMLENTSKENNSLQKNMEEISLKNPTLSTIPKITTKISEMNTIKNGQIATERFLFQKEKVKKILFEELEMASIVLCNLFIVVKIILSQKMKIQVLIFQLFPMEEQLWQL